MVMQADTHRLLARRLYEAEVSGKLIDSTSAEFEVLTFDDAYAVQAEIAALKQAAGMSQIGWKTMGTNPAILAARGAALGMTEPGRGYLFETALAAMPLLLPQGHVVFAEPEISFVLQRDIAGPGVTAEQVLGATKEVCGSIEIAWSRFEGRPSPVALVADNAGAARIVLSSRRLSVTDAQDLARISVEFLQNGEVVQTGTGEAVLGGPANAVAWLANQLAKSGLGLKAGQVVLAGSLTLPVPVQAGDTVLARFDKLGDVEARIA